MGIPCQSFAARITPSRGKSHAPPFCSMQTSSSETSVINSMWSGATKIASSRVLNIVTSTDEPSTTPKITTHQAPKNQEIEILETTQKLQPTTEILEECEPINLGGPMAISFEQGHFRNFAEIYATEGAGVEPGGLIKPKNCRPPRGASVAIIIPIRDDPKKGARTIHLQWLLRYLIPVLKRQNNLYKIFVVNQIQGQPWNKAILMNTGFKEAQKENLFDCYMFHDVDIILENQQCIYRCFDNPTHYSVAIDKYDYALPYERIFGGIVAFTPKRFTQVNGFSNEYWGWGGEDDDLYSRTRWGEKLLILRPMREIARFKMIVHDNNDDNDVPEIHERRMHLLETSLDRYKTDGLTNLKYKIVDRKNEPLFTNITVDCLWVEKN